MIAATTPTWLAAAMGEADVTDICLNGPDEGFLDRGQGLVPVAIPPEERWSQEQMREWVLGQMSQVGRSWDAKHPFLDASLPSGHRLHVAFPPMSRRGLLVSLRRLSQGTRDLSSNSRWAGTPYSARAFERLRQAVVAGDSVLLSGSTGSGKTTLAGDLLGHVPLTERMIALEDTPELAPAHPHYIGLQTRPANADGYGEVTLRALLRQTLRMRPDRIILGECRGGEVMDLLQSLNTGHRGAMATLHANTARDALRRIELLCLLAGSGSVPLSALRELIANGIQWVAHVKRLPEGRAITELVKIEGREGDTILLRPMVQGQP